MKRWVTLLCLSAGLLTAVPRSGMIAQGQGPEHAAVIIPDSTVEHPDDIGARAHTNHLIFMGHGGTVGSSPSGETPASIRPVYSIPSTGGGGVIAIVDAFDYPTAQSDFDTFSSQFGLPLSSGTCSGGPCFTKVYATVKPRKNCGWAQEAALDIEWAHAMAPSAQIVLVEAASNFFSDLFQAVDVATHIVTASGKTGQVSMSWGGSEFSSEATNDFHFTTGGVVYFAASGDTGGVNIYPSVSPNVVSAGGTTIHRNPDGTFSETAWSGSGGGPSQFEPKPIFQSGIAAITGSTRDAPDFSFDADPASGVSVFDSTPCQGLSGWLVFGGTSVSSPSLSGIVNLSGSTNSSSANELSTIYTNLGTANFRDITSGCAGSFCAMVGWDFVTGVGSDQGTIGK